LRNLFIDEQDVKIGKIYEQYFLAVRDRWPEAWEEIRPGMILNRTNGYRALASLFGPIYQAVGKVGDYVASSAYLELLNRVNCDSDYFNTDNFPPGTSGEAGLRRFISESLFGEKKLI